jgi:pimeloyl-ACP methyl ester carboxylesterase
MWAVKLLLIPLVFYLALIALLFVLQTWILFPARMAGPPGRPPPAAERLSFQAPGGYTLHGIQIPAETTLGGERTLILGFGGNAWNAEVAAAYLHDLYPEAHIVAFHYRGYRPSEGSPSAAALVEDAALAYDLAVQTVRPGRTIAIGFSIGSGIAASLAPRRTLDGLILVTPFDSLEAVAAGQYRWLPVRWLFRHPLPVADWLSSSKVPTAIIAAAKDRLIPAARTDALRRRGPDAHIRADGPRRRSQRPLSRAGLSAGDA